MNLEKLILELNSLPLEKVVEDGFSKPMSWRGSYNELAFKPAKNVTIGSMLDSAKSAMGKYFEGYKGGDFFMDRRTKVHIANYGELGEPITSANITLWSI